MANHDPWVCSRCGHEYDFTGSFEHGTVKEVPHECVPVALGKQMQQITETDLDKLVEASKKLIEEDKRQIPICLQRPTAVEVSKHIEEMHPNSLFRQQLEWGEKMVIKFEELGPHKVIVTLYSHRNRDTGNGINWG